jgi:hypothetical protein
MQPCGPADVVYILPLQVAFNSAGKLRLVWDGTHVNEHLPEEPFRMETLQRVSTCTRRRSPTSNDNGQTYVSLRDLNRRVRFAELNVEEAVTAAVWALRQVAPAGAPPPPPAVAAFLARFDPDSRVDRVLPSGPRSGSRRVGSSRAQPGSGAPAPGP